MREEHRDWIIQGDDWKLPHRIAAAYLEGVLLDFGGTLAHVNKEGDQVYKKQLLSVVKEFGYKEGLSDFTSVFDDVLRLSHEGAFKTLEAFWSLVVERLDIYGETEALSRKLEELRIHHSPSTYKIFEGTIATLGHLQERDTTWP